MTKRYAVDLGPGTTFNGVRSEGETTFETELSSGLFIRTNAIELRIARDDHAAITRMLGQDFASSTTEVFR